MSALQSPDLSVTRVRERLGTASDLLDDAGRYLARPAPRLAAVVPVLGRSWRAEQRIVAAAQEVVAAAEVGLDAVPSLRAPDGRVDVAALLQVAGRLEDRAGRVEAAFQDLVDTPTGLTPPVVRRAVDDGVTTLRPAVQGVQDAADGAALAASVLGADGPRTMLVAIGNNAELRGTVGYVSSFAIGTAAEGGLSLGPFDDVIDVLDPPESARRVPAPAEFREDYGPYLADTTFWRMWTMTPDAPDAAEVGAAVAEQLVGVRPDVVLFLDVPAVASFVRLTGEPVKLPDGTTVSADRLVDALLADAYAAAGGTAGAQDERRRALQAAAGTAAASLLSADLDLAAAGRELARLGRGRHLALWSARPEDQERLTRLGMAGSVTPRRGPAPDDSLLVTVNNLSANKLDYWVERTVVHEAAVSSDRAEVVQTARLRSIAPDDLVPYVLGTVTPGRSSLRVEFSVPPTATVSSLTVDGKPATGDVRVGADRTRVFGFATLDRAGTVEVQVRYAVPLVNGRYVLRLVPQALARDAALTVRVRSPDGTRLATPEGFTRQPGGGLALVGELAEERTVDFRPDNPEGLWALWTRVRAFWTEPVTIG